MGFTNFKKEESTLTIFKVLNFYGYTHCNCSDEFYSWRLSTKHKKIKKYIRQACNNHADIILFPEMCVNGYPPEDLLLKTQFF